MSNIKEDEMGVDETCGGNGGDRGSLILILIKEGRGMGNK